MLGPTRLRFATKVGATARGQTDEPIRLCSANIPLMSGVNDLQLPKYDRSAIIPGVVNLGLRDFHRVHNAVYFDKLLNSSVNKSWGIISVALSDPQRKLVPEMKVQNGMYTVVSKEGKGLSNFRVIGSILDVLNGIEDSNRVADIIASNSTRMVTLTLKESNYFFTPDFSRLDVNDSHVRADMLAGSNKTQRTPVGMLVLGLFRRYKSKGTPITILSCENLMRNGEIARMMVEQYAVLRYPLNPDFHRWLSANVFYPNSVCDRICLTDSSNDKVAMQQLFGIRDNALLTTESFSEWIVEKWMGNKPEGMKDAGIKLVASTVPYENLKIRLNYGTRLSVAIVSKALGHTTFETALKDPTVLKFAKRYMDEVSHGLGQLPTDIDLSSYKKHMIERMSTDELNYVTHRVVESASKKARVDWQPVLDSLPTDASASPMMSHAIATWAHLLAHSPMCKSDHFPIIDVNSARLQPLAKEMIGSVHTPNAESTATKFVAEVFGPDSQFKPLLVKNIISSLKGMEKLGIAGELSRLVN